MKIPRDISGSDLVRLLKPYGYTVTRQSGSHMRLTTYSNGEHHITIPAHDPLKVGTLSAILSDIAAHFNKTKDQVVKDLF
jgi:predicted RNA binding protein YcfA (HicA-like mRNA interferase family)